MDARQDLFYAADNLKAGRVVHGRQLGQPVNVLSHREHDAWVWHNPATPPSCYQARRKGVDRIGAVHWIALILLKRRRRVPEKGNKHVLFRLRDQRDADGAGARQ